MHKSIFLFKCNEIELANVKLLNVDSVFIGYENLDKEFFLRSILKPGTKIFVSLNVFNFQNATYLKYLQNEAKMVEAFGQALPEGALCPNNVQVRQVCLDNVKKILDTDIDGIWLDSLCYPSAHGNPKPVLYETCYCNDCLSKFEKFIDEKIAGDNVEEKHLEIDGKFYIEWIDFKTEVIASLVNEVRELIKTSGKKVELGYMAVPLEGSEYGEAVKRVMGQDFMKLSKYVDYVSPALFHKISYRNIEWIKEKAYYFAQTGNAVLPFIQTENTPESFDSVEFKQALVNASKYPSSGVVVFFLDNLMVQAEKLSVLNDVFGNGI